MINKFLLATNKSTPEMNLKQSEFTYTACGPFTKNKEIKKQQKILKKQETQDIFNKMNQIKLVFNMI